MHLRLIDQISIAGDGVNEDRAALSRAYAWVIDGATDVLDKRLTLAATDADWIAGTLDATLRAYAARPACAFADLPGHITASLSDAFAEETSRQPRSRHEHPSASGLIVKYEAGVLSYVSIGDCSMIVADKSYDEVRRFGVGNDEAGDRKLDPIVRAHLEGNARDAADAAPHAPLLKRMRTTLQSIREHMNHEHGYGVFSITPTPDIFIRAGFVSVEPGTRILLATDGFMRLVDVFACYDPERLVGAVAERGLSNLVSELRALECATPTTGITPRIKPSDDASALLIDVIS